MDTTDFTLVLNGDAYALYVRRSGSDDSRYHLADSGTDESGNAQRMARVMMQAQTGSEGLVLNDLPHLNAGGTWHESVTVGDFQESTPRQRVEAKIANLRAQAHDLREAAGYSGSYSDGGAQHLIDYADGMQFALDTLFGTSGD